MGSRRPRNEADAGSHLDGVRRSARALALAVLHPRSHGSLSLPLQRLAGGAGASARGAVLSPLHARSLSGLRPDGWRAVPDPVSAAAPGAAIASQGGLARSQRRPASPGVGQVAPLVEAHAVGGNHRRLGALRPGYFLAAGGARPARHAADGGSRLDFFLVDDPGSFVPVLYPRRQSTLPLPLQRLGGGACPPAGGVLLPDSESRHLSGLRPYGPGFLSHAVPVPAEDHAGPSRDRP